MTSWPDKPVTVIGTAGAGNVTMLGIEGKIKYSSSGNKLTIYPPSVSPLTIPCDFAWVYKVHNALK